MVGEVAQEGTGKDERKEYHVLVGQDRVGTGPDLQVLLRREPFSHKVRALICNAGIEQGLQAYKRPLSVDSDVTI